MSPGCGRTSNGIASPRARRSRHAECLVQERGLKYKSVAVYLISIANIARWCHAMIKRNGGEAAARLDNSVLDELDSLHRQCKAQARKQDAFDTDTPINWLTWEECQTSRVIAETKCLQAGSAPCRNLRRALVDEGELPLMPRQMAR